MSELNSAECPTKIVDKVKTLDVLLAQHKEWELANFGLQPVWLPALGVSEECGELAHCMLKFTQGIRGFDMLKYISEGRDAIGDIGIYALAVAWKIPNFIFATHLSEHQLNVSEWAIPVTVEEYKARIISASSLYANLQLNQSTILHTCSHIATTTLEDVSTETWDTLAEDVAALFLALATITPALFGVEFVSILAHTWKNIVQKRNWKTPAAPGEPVKII